MKAFKTDYIGVYYNKVDRIGKNGTERSYFVTFKKDGKKIEERVGRQYADQMTPAKANIIRSDLIEGRRPLKRDAIAKAKKKVWTIDALWTYYDETETRKNFRDEKSLYNKWLKPDFEKKRPEDIIPLDIDRLRSRMQKAKGRAGKYLSPQRIKHALELLQRIINYGETKGLTKGLTFKKIQKPKVNNMVTEDLSQDELERLLKAIDEDEHPFAGPMMLLALFSGMRRGEMFRLKWSDIDFDSKWLLLRDPKGGPDQKIPLNDAAEMVLDNLFSKYGRADEFVFFGRNGQRVDISKPVRRIKDAAGLPKSFRPLHGLRHVYASTLASSGKVDMFSLQKLLTHKSPQMTARYAHLRDEALRRSADVAGEIFTAVQKGTNDLKIAQK